MQIFWFLPEDLPDKERQGALEALERLQSLGTSVLIEGPFDPEVLKPDSLAILTYDLYREIQLTAELEKKVWGGIQSRVIPGEPIKKEVVQLLDLDAVSAEDFRSLCEAPRFQEEWILPDWDTDAWQSHLGKHMEALDWHGREEWLRGLLLGAKRGALPQTPIQFHLGQDWVQVRFFSPILPVWPGQRTKGSFEQLLFYFADCIELNTCIQDKPLVHEWRASLWRQPVGPLKPDGLRTMRFKKERILALSERFTAKKTLEIGRVLPIRAESKDPLDLERYQQRYFEVKRDLEGLARKLVKLELNQDKDPAKMGILLQEMEALNHQLRKWVGALLKEVSRGKRRASGPF